MEHATTPPTVDVVKPEPQKMTTWSTPRRRPPSMSSSRSRGRRRHGARHDAAHHQCRQAGAAEDDDMEHATTPPTVDEPEPRKTTRSTPRRCPSPRSSSRGRGRRRHGARHDAIHHRCRRAGAGKDDTEFATTLLAFTPLHRSRSRTPLTPSRARSLLPVAPQDGRDEGGVPRRHIHYMTGRRPRVSSPLWTYASHMCLCMGHARTSFAAAHSASGQDKASATPTMLI
ncbi:hypothetical protein D1007_06820 [Hordeum vulgare]|nr:hypothetical protein D1007_06820 [Hordeum vulgare]